MRTEMLALAGLLLTACPGPGFDASGPVPDFSLEEVNASSATYGELISPSDFLGKASAWYFGHSN